MDKDTDKKALVYTSPEDAQLGNMLKLNLGRLIEKNPSLLEGWEVSTKEDAAEALAYITEMRGDAHQELVLVLAQLDDGEGLKLHAKARENDGKTPFILSTGGTSLDLSELEDDPLAKILEPPVSLEKMQSAIAELLIEVACISQESESSPEETE
jgi:DNA-binding NtrC family response regulator